MLKFGSYVILVKDNLNLPSCAKLVEYKYSDMYKGRFHLISDDKKFWPESEVLAFRRFEWTYEEWKVWSDWQDKRLKKP